MGTEALYMKVYNNILAGIHSFEYPENAPLPSERALCEKYHVSRTTIRQALEKLQSDGFIYILAGNGSFVKPHFFEQPLTKLYSFTDELKKSNILIYNQNIAYELITAGKTLSDKLPDSNHTIFHKLVRLRSAEQYPLMIETTYLPKERFPLFDIDILDRHGSLYNYLMQQYPFHIDNATETLRPVLPNAHERSLLNIPATVPCTCLERFAYEDQVMIEYTKSIVRGDKYIFTVNLLNQDTPNTADI